MTPEKLKTSLPKWKLVDGVKLTRTIHFKDFVEAFSFLTTIAFEAEKMGHHPEMLSGYNRVEFTLTTHDAKGLTHLDEDMAHIIDAHAAKVVA